MFTSVLKVLKQVRIAHTYSFKLGNLWWKLEIFLGG